MMNNEPPELTFIDNVIALWKTCADQYQTFRAFMDRPEARELRGRYEHIDPLLMPWGASREEFKSFTSLARLEMRSRAGIATAAEEKVAQKLRAEEQRQQRQHARKQRHYIRWLTKHFPQPPGTHLVEVTLVIHETAGIFQCFMADEYEECLWQLAWELVMHDPKDRWNILIRPASALKEKQMWLRVSKEDDYRL